MINQLVAAVSQTKKGIFQMNFVYFAGCGDMVKIGVTRTVYQRIKTLNTASPAPITLLAHMVGGVREEALLLGLGRREKLHVRGEWFRMGGRLSELIGVIAPIADPYAARGVADQWWMDNLFGTSKEVLPDNRWLTYARAAGIERPTT